MGIFRGRAVLGELLLIGDFGNIIRLFLQILSDSKAVILISMD